MADLAPSERLQPSLLDRLTDDEPDKREEGRDKRVLSLTQLRQSVLRDLSWLLNTTSLAAVQDLDEYPYASHSVINFGMPDLTGRTLSSVDRPAMERLLRQAVVDFEPRILSDTVKVRLVVDQQKMSHNAMIFDIEGELWAQPVPLRVLLKTEVDLEVGAVSVADYSGSGMR